MDPNTRQAKRAPVTLKIKFKSVTIDQFIERYAADVSPGGIFIRTKEPLAVGTQMRFEFQLRDATPLITGDGTVVWTRENDPTRPNAAPGMGVRFDRLGDGSQPILDRILAEKAKQPTPSTGTTEPPPNKSFMDAPTRVAPSPLVGALAAEPKPKMGQMAPSKAGFADERTDTTPLPRPMPFHSDADEFPEETFEEATKVRALDDLVAATAAASAAEPSRPAERPSAPAARTSDRAIATPARISDRAIVEPVARTSDRAIASVDRTAPVVAIAEPIVDEPEPAVRAVPVPSDPPARVIDEPIAKPPAAAARVAAAAAVTAAAKPVAAAEPTAVPGTSSRGTSAVVIGLLLAAIVAAAVWFFVLRKRHEPKPDVETPVAAVVPDAAVTPTEDAAVAAVTPDAPDAPAVPVVTAALVVKASVAGATVEVVETGATGPAPFTTELEVGKPFTLRVKAPGFVAAELQATGGDKTATAKLEPMPRFVRVTTTPPGVEIGIDGTNSGQVSPAEVALTKAQAAKGSVRVYLRKRGFASATVTVKSSEFSEDGDKLVATVTSDLAVVKTGGGGGGSASGSGSDAGSGSGSGSAAGSGSGSAAGSGSGSGSAAGSGSGSASGSGSGSAAGSGSGSGSATPTGTGSGSGSATPTGSGSGSAKPATGSGSGSATGTGSGTAKPPTGSGSGSGTSTGPTPDWTNP